AISTANRARHLCFLADGAGNGASDGFGGVVHQARIQRAESKTCGMAQRELIALEAQLVPVTVGRGGAGGAVAVQPIQGTELALVVVVGLATALDIQGEVVVLMGGKRQARTNRVFLAFNR